MPRPTDWNAIGLSGDPTPGEPEKITQLAGTFSELGGTARRIWDAIQQVMSTTNGAFVGEAADALRSKVDQRLAGHVEDVAWAFETSAQALNEWAATVTEQQQKADTALAAGRGLAEDDPQREQLASTAREAGETQAAQGRSVAGRIESVSHIQLPISACKVFWEAFQWLAIILIIPALVLGGPIALLALGVNLTLFIKTIVDFARGDASFLDLFLAGLGLIAPTTKGLPIFKIIKSVASAVGKGLKGLGTAALQVMRNLFTGGTLSFAHLLPNLRDVLVLTTSWVRQGGLWVMAGIRNLPHIAAGAFQRGGLVVVGGLKAIPGLLHTLPIAIGKGVSFIWRAGGTGVETAFNFARAELGNGKWLRLLLPVDAGEIGQFGLARALRIGFVERGVFGQFRYGAPLAGAVGHTISAAPIRPTDVNGLVHMSRIELAQVRLGDWAGQWAGLKPFEMTQGPLHATLQPPAPQFGQLGQLGVGVADRASLGFHASRQLDALLDIPVHQLGAVRTGSWAGTPVQLEGNLGVSAVATPSFAHASSGLYLPASAGAPAAAGHGIAGLTGTPMPSAVHTALAGVQAPPMSGTATVDLLTSVRPGSTPAPAPAVLAATATTPPGVTLSPHMPVGALPGSVVGVEHTALAAAAPPPSTAGTADLLAPVSHTGTPATAHTVLQSGPNFQPASSGGVSALDLVAGGRARPEIPTNGAGALFADHTTNLLTIHQIRTHMSELVQTVGVPHPAGPGSADRMGATASLGDSGHGVRTPVSGGDRSLGGAPDNQALAGVPGTQGAGSGTHGTAGAPSSGAPGQPPTGLAAVDASVLKAKGRADAPAVTNSPVEGGDPARNITADHSTVLPDTAQVPAGTGNLATPPPVTRAPAETGGSTAPGPHHGAVNPDRTPAGASQARGMGPQSRDLTLQQIHRLANRDAERFDALFGATDDPLRFLRRGAWLEFSEARQAVGQADRRLDNDAARHGGGSSSNPTSHQIHLQKAADDSRQHYGDAYRKLTDLGVDPALLDRDLTALYARSLVERPRTVAGMPASDAPPPPVSRQIPLTGFDGRPTGEVVRVDVTGPEATFGNPRLEGGQGTHGGIQTHDGGFRLTRLDGGSSDFDGNGQLIMERRPLQGNNGSPFFGMAVDIRTGNGGALTHTLHPAGGPRLDVLDNGDLRVSDPNDGRTSVFHADGSRVEDGMRLRGPAGLFENGDRIITTRPGEHAVTNVQGTPVPGATVQAVDNSGFRVTDAQTGSSVRFTSMGVEVERGTALVDPLQGTRYTMTDGSGQVHLTDVNGTRVPGATVQRVDNSGFRVTDTSGSSALFNARGVHREGGTALIDPLHGTRYTMTDGSGQVHLTDVNGTRLPDRVFAVPGNSGFRVADGTGYRSYAPDGSFHGHGVQLTGGTATGHLDFHPNGTFRQRLDDPFVSNQGGPVQAAGNEYTIDLPQAIGPFQRQEVFDTHGALLRAREEVKLRQSPRLGEFTEFDAHNNRIRQGFNVLDDGGRTDFQYVIDFPTGTGSATWRRTGGGPTVVHDGAFHHGPAKAYGPGDDWIRLDSSTGGKGVPVFERRPLPGGDTLDSFRRTDTVAFGNVNRRTTWVQWDAAGELRGWGKRHFDTAGTGWSDVTHSRMGDHRARTTIREYRDGLQKYDDGKAGHVLALKGDNGDWTWHRYNGAGKRLVDGTRTRDFDGGWTDRVTGSDTVVQRQWGEWHHPENARHYKELKLDLPPGQAQGPWRPGPLWERQSPHGKESGKMEELVKGGDFHLTTERIGEQRPPVSMRNDPALPPSHAHFGGDNGFQMYAWSKTHSTTQADAGGGLRYVAMDGGTVDIHANGSFVRSKTKLHYGNELRVGDYVPDPPGTAGHPLRWQEGPSGGTPIRSGVRQPTPQSQDTLWKDLVDTPGVPEAQWRVAREGLPDGTVREYSTPRSPNENMGSGSWVTRDAHGNLTGIQHPSRTPGANGLTDQFIRGTGRQDSESWTWKVIDDQGKDATTTGGGPLTGKREFFRGSHDPALSWDDSFRDFGADGRLIRDRRMLNNGSYVEAWDNGGGWSSAKYGRDDVQVPNGGTQTRQWLKGDGTWGDTWTPGADHWRDMDPPGPQNAGRVLRSVGTHDIQVGSNAPLRDHTVSGVCSLRVREYHAQTDGVWKEFDHGSVVRQRSADAGNFLETDAWRGQWRRYDNNNQLIAQRTDSGLVFEMRGTSLQLTGNEYDFRGPLTEIRGWGRRVREAQRMPWSSTPLSIGESVYTPYWKTVAGKAALEFGQELILEFGANLAVNGIAAAVQHKPFTGKDALKSFANAAVSAGIKGGVGTMIHENSVRGFLTLGAGRAGVANLDSGKHWSRRPFNHEKTWANEWGGNETATRWRGGSYDFGFGVGTSVLAGWVNGSMNAAVWGITDANGNTVRLHGADAVGDGGINALASLTTSVSTGLVKNIALLTTSGRLFHRQGFADFWLQLPFKIFEKSIQGTFLTSAYREGIKPNWFQVPPPAPVSLAAFTLGPAFGSGPGVPGAAPASSQQNQ